MSRRVLFKSLNPAKPVFHYLPEFWGTATALWRGDVVHGCNRSVYAGTDTTIGNNDGVDFPEEVVTPCGLTAYHRRPIVERTEAWGGTQRINDTRMTQWGIDVPRRHAEKFGRPCRTCFPPKETT